MPDPDAEKPKPSDIIEEVKLDPETGEIIAKRDLTPPDKTIEEIAINTDEPAYIRKRRADKASQN